MGGPVRHAEVHQSRFPISAEINVDDTQVAVDIDLPMAAMMFKGRVEEVLKKNLSACWSATRKGP